MQNQRDSQHPLPTFADPHCCASCKHVRVRRDEGRVVVYCHRLGYETRPEWRFRCWKPNKRIQARQTRI